MKRNVVSLCFGVAAQALIGAMAVGPVLAQTGPTAPAGSDWPTYGHDKGGMRFSPLTQITPANVASLQPAWVFHMRPAGAAPGATAQGAAAAAQAVSEGIAPPPGAPATAPAVAAGAPGPQGRPGGGGGMFGPNANGFAASQATPLMVGGLMYLTTPYKRVVALEPETGKEVWSFEVDGTGQPSQRG
ncbi:MAG TPA: hypothetical protein VF633_09990, partial [Brevundimonas sp.]